MSDLELPSGLVVRGVEQRLASFLEEEWLYYDAIADEQPNEIIVVDVLAPVFVNAYFSGSATTLRGIHRGLAGACNELLAKISVEADLRATNAPMDELRELLAAAVGIRGVLIPVATKVLFRKRRELIPILDNEIIRYYAEVLGHNGLIGRSQDSRPQVVAGVAATVLEAFQKDLIGAYDALCDLALLSRERGQGVGPVRALEILIWTEVEPRGYYRQG